MIAPQYYSGNQPREDGYERDDAMRAAFCYALANFAVDRDRVYVTGTSQAQAVPQLCFVTAQIILQLS